MGENEFVVAEGCGERHTMADPATMAAPQVDSLDATLKKKKEGKYDADLEANAREWVGAVLGET